MSYSRSTYRGRSSYRRDFTAGRVERVNRRAGECKDCGELVPAGAGQLYRNGDGTWAVVHVPSQQGGWLMNPQPVRGGCPEDTDKRNAELFASGFLGRDAAMPASEHDHIAQVAATYAATHEIEPARSGHGLARGQLGQRGHVFGYRCEDAPCCGCCD